MNTLQLGDDGSDVLGARGHFDAGNLLCRPAERHRMHIGADAANALDQRDGGDPFPALDQQLDGAAGDPDLDAGFLDGVGGTVNAQLVGLLERRMVGSDRDRVRHGASAYCLSSLAEPSSASRKNPSFNPGGRRSGMRFGWPMNWTAKKSWISRSNHDAIRSVGVTDGIAPPRVEVVKLTYRSRCA